MPDGDGNVADDGTLRINNNIADLVARERVVADRVQFSGPRIPMREPVSRRGERARQFAAIIRVAAGAERGDS